MALLKEEDFEAYEDADDLPGGGWTVVGTPLIETSTVLQGTKSLKLDANERIRTAVSGTPQTCFVTFAFRWEGAAPTRQVFRFSNATTVGNTSLRLDADGHLGLFNATAVQLGSTSSGSLNADTWYYIQIKASHKDALVEDDYIVWVWNGSEFEEWINPTSGDSAFSGATVTEAEFICTTGNGSYYDSFALWDTTGDAPWNGPLEQPFGLDLGGKVKIYDGAEWVARPALYHDGANWVEAPAKVWDGAEWVPTTS